MERQSLIPHVHHVLLDFILSGGLHNRRFGLRTFKQVFTGAELVSWLVANNHAVDREDAVGFGERLFECNLIFHVTHEHFFSDSGACVQWERGCAHTHTHTHTHLQATSTDSLPSPTRRPS